MRKPFLPQISLGILALMVAGCTSTASNGGGVETRAYIDNRERVDQNMKGGNYGYVGGTPKEPDRSKYSTKRQVYTLEFTKDPGVTPEDFRKPVPPAQPVPLNVPSSSTSSRSSEPQGISLPDFEDAPQPAAASSGSTEYVIERGDTLQKISKKFYGSYSKWNRIYEANKDIIPNPNRIKPGLTIRIPQ